MQSSYDFLVALKNMGYAFESYMQLQNWMQEGVEVNFDKITQMYDTQIILHIIYARFHRMIVDFAKEHIYVAKMLICKY